MPFLKINTLTPKLSVIYLMVLIEGYSNPENTKRFIFNQNSAINIHCFFVNESSIIYYLFCYFILVFSWKIDQTRRYYFFIPVCTINYGKLT